MGVELAIDDGLMRMRDDEACVLAEHVLKGAKTTWIAGGAFFAFGCVLTLTVTEL